MSPNPRAEPCICGAAQAGCWARWGDSQPRRRRRRRLPKSPPRPPSCSATRPSRGTWSPSCGGPRCSQRRRCVFVYKFLHRHKLCRIPNSVTTSCCESHTRSCLAQVAAFERACRCCSVPCWRSPGSDACRCGRLRFALLCFQGVTWHAGLPLCSLPSPNSSDSAALAMLNGAHAAEAVSQAAVWHPRKIVHPLWQLQGYKETLVSLRSSGYKSLHNGVPFSAAGHGGDTGGAAGGGAGRRRGGTGGGARVPGLGAPPAPGGPAVGA